MKGPSHHVTSFLLALASIELGDRLENLHLFIDEGDSSTVIVRAHSDPHVRSPHGQSSQVGIIVDPYE